MEKESTAFQIAYREDPPYEVLSTNWISYEELLKLKGIEEMVELCYNSGQFTATLNILESTFTSPFVMYEELAAFFRQQGFVLSNPSRESRYRILLDFAIQRNPEKQKLFEELLTYDLYLRENLKKRPSFSRNLSAHRETIRKFQADRGQHVEVFFHPVWKDDPTEASEQREEPYFILFDYENRNPLDHNGRIKILEPDLSV